jgi:benzoylformate decarboxylase
MDDWLAQADPLAAGAPHTLIRPQAVPAQDMAALAELLGHARSPAIVVGAGAATGAGWRAVVELAEALEAPVYQEAFGSRAGFPQDHPLFAGHLPWARRGIRDRLTGHDTVLVIGTHAFRTYLFDDEVALVDQGTRVAVISDDPAEVHRSPCEVAVLAAVAPACAALAARIPARDDEAPAATPPATHQRPPAPAPPAPGDPIKAGHVLAAVAERLPADAVLVEETPSSRPELQERIPVRSPLGFVSNGNGALGFAIPGATGLRLALPARPVIGVIGDGSAMYAIQGLWSAAHYRVGVLLIVMNNGGYAIMDAQARERGGTGAWPAFGAIDIAGIARGLGCTARKLTEYSQLIATLDEVIPGLAERQEPLLLEVGVSP